MLPANPVSFGDILFRTWLWIVLFIGTPCVALGQTLAWEPNEPLVVCPGTPQTVGVRVTGVFGAGNRFRVELSDGNGSFATPQVVGFIDRGGNLNERLEISVLFPDVAYTGAAYRLRVVSTAPEGVSDLRRLIFVFLNAAQRIAETCENSNGVIDVTFNTAGGPANLYFANRPPEPVQGNSGLVYSNLAAGPYAVELRTAAGCTLRRQLELERLWSTRLVSASANVTSTCTAADGLISVELTTPPNDFIEFRIEDNEGRVVFDWRRPLRLNNAGSGNREFTYPTDFAGPPAGLRAGTYRIVLRDGLGCINQRVVEVRSPDNPTINDITAVRQPRCGADPTGVIRVEAEGNGQLQLYLDGQLVASGLDPLDVTIPNLPAARYRLRLIDGNSCIFETDYTLEAQETDFVIFTEAQAPTCGQTNGVLRIWAEPPGDYRFSLNGGPEQATGRFDGLSGGLTFRIAVRDAATGCVRTTVADIDEGTRPVFEVSLTRQPTCSDPTGDFLLAVSDAVEPVQFFVNDELRPECLGTLCNIANLPAGGTYRFRVVDASGCTVDTTIALQLTGQPRLSQVMIVPPCAGQANGSLTFGVTGQGTIRVTVDGPGGAVPNSGPSPLVVSRSNLRAGTYRIVVVDDNNCPAETTVVLADRDPIDIRVTASNSTCQDRFSGSLLIEVRSGPPGLMFSLGPPPFTNRTTEPFFTNLGRGTYTVFAFDPEREDCFVQSPPVEIVEINYLRDLLEAPGVQVPPVSSCFNSNTGEIRLNLPPALIVLHGLQFSLDGGNTWTDDPHFRNLAPGTYRLLVRDRDGCEHELTNIVVQASPAIQNVAVQVIQPTCTEPTGSIIVAAAGGTPPLTYLLSAFNDPNAGSYQATGFFAGLAAPNRYYIFVRDGKGCTVAAAENPISLEPSRAATLAVVDFFFPSCIGASDGWVEVRANGTPPFRFSRDGNTFSPPQTETIYRFTGFTAGDYVLTVEDGANCRATANFRPRDPLPLQVVELPAETRGPLCSEGPRSGYITVNGQGGNSPARKADPNAPAYEFSLDGQTWQTNPRFSGLGPGTYRVRVRINGAPGCPPAEREITLAQPPLLFVDAFEIRRLPCPNEALNPGGGRLYIRLRGGDPAHPPRISLLDAATATEEDFYVGFEHEFQNLRAKTYTLTAVDVYSDCEIDPIENVELEASPVVRVESVLRAPTCPGFTDGAVELRASGGTPNLLYSRDGTAYGPEAVFGGLAAGSGPFTFFVRDNSTNDPLYNQCLYRIPVPGPIPNAAPLPQFVDVRWSETSCNSFLLQAVAEGGRPPLEYVLSLSGTEIERNRSGEFINLAPGRYRIEVVDARPCTSAAREVELRGSNLDLELTLQGTDPRCAANGSIVATARPAGRYEYSLNGGPWQTSNRFDDLDAGTYTVRARQLDPPNCEVPSQSVTLSGANLARISFAPPTSQPSCGGQASGRINLDARTTNGTLTVVLRQRGSSSPLQSVTAPPAVAPFVFENLSAGAYEILLSDDSGCPPRVVEVAISERPQPNLTVRATAPVCPPGTEASVPELLEGFFTLSAADGTPPYRYAFLGETAQTDSIFRRDAQGNPLQVAVPYRFVAVDAVGCESAPQAAVLSPALPLMLTVGPEADPLRPYCNRPGVGVRLTGTATGAGRLQFQLLDAGGTPVFDQVADQGSFTFSDVLPGTYRLQVIDFRGEGRCTLQVDPPIVVPEGPELELRARTLAQPSCGIDNGEIEIESIAGFDSPEVLLNGLDVSNYTFEDNTFKNLAENTYVLRVEERRERRCFVEQTFDLRAVGSIMIDPDAAVRRPCFGQANGRWQFRASGGTNLRFTLERLDNQQVVETWQNTTGLFTDLPPGTYRLALVNDEGCRALREDLELLAYDELRAQPVYDGPTCANPTRLQVTAQIEGGAGGYGYSVDGGQSWYAPSTARPLLAGQRFTLAVRDTAGCTFEAEFTAPTAASGLKITVINTQNPRCSDSRDGWVEIDIEGGLPPYRLSVDNGPLADVPANGRIANLAAERDYRLLVVDATVPPCSSEVLVVRLEAPQAIVLTLTDVQAPTCHDQADGRFTVAVSGGAPDYNLEIFRDDQPFDQLSDLRPDAPESFSDLPVGLYRLVATDANRCSQTERVDFRVPPVDAGPDRTLCAAYWRPGERRSLDLRSWGNPAGGRWTGDRVVGDSLIYTDAELGRTLQLVYTVGACSDTVLVRLEGLSLTPEISACVGERIDLNAQPAGGTWLDEAGDLPAGALQGAQLDLGGVSPGRYRLSYRALSGCEAVQTVVVHPLPDASFRIETPERQRIVNETITLAPTRTEPGWTHNWQIRPTGGAATGSQVEVRCSEPGRHVAYHAVQTAAGCRATDSLAFVVLPLPQLQLPLVFTPNEDGINDRFPTIGGDDGLRPEVLRSLEIYDRAGQRVWVWERGQAGWDGTRNGRPVAEGVYYWRAELQPADAPQPVVRTGQVTLIR